MSPPAPDRPPAARPLFAVLGAGPDQLFLIRTAQSLGLQVVAVDRDPAAPGLALADHALVVSTRDVPALLRELDRLRAQGARLRGVLTMGSDIPDTVARVAEHLGLPGPSRATARWATDKLAMKERLQAQGIPVPPFAALDSPADLQRRLERTGRPLVVKPVDRSGSRGVFRVDPGTPRPSLERFFHTARELSLSGGVVVEEFLDGPQISTETVLSRGRAVTPGFADRNYDLLPRFLPRIIENGGWVPSRLSASDRRAVETLVERASRALGVSDGVTKGDVVLTPRGPVLIEMAARLSGGDFCESLVPLGSGVNYVATAVRIALGETPDLSALAPRFERAVANRYFFPPSGVLEGVDGVEEVRSWPWVHKLAFAFEPGEPVPEPTSHAERFGVFVVSAPDRAVLEERIRRVYATIRIRVRQLARAAAR